MATTKTFTIERDGGSPVQLAPRVLSSDVVASGVYRNLSDIDLGAVEQVRHTSQRAVGDGTQYRGRARRDRLVSIDLASEVNVDVVAAADVEKVRDDELEWWGSFLSAPTLYRLTVARQDASSSAVSRFIRGVPTSLRAWKWSPDAFAAGLVGPYSGPHLVLPLELWCPFPWFESTTAETESALTLDGTSRATTINNPGDAFVGAKFTFSGTGTGLTIAVSNTTSGATNDVGNGFTLTGVSLTAGDIILDWFQSDPLSWSLTQGGVSIASVLSSGAGLKLQPARGVSADGDNEITRQVTAGTPTGCTMDIAWSPAWVTP